MDEVLTPVREMRHLDNWDSIGLEGFYAAILALCAEACELGQYSSLANPVVTGVMMDKFLSYLIFYLQPCGLHFTFLHVTKKTTYVHNCARSGWVSKSSLFPGLHRDRDLGGSVLLSWQGSSGLCCGPSGGPVDPR